MGGELHCRESFFAGNALFPLELVKSQAQVLVDLAERIRAEGAVGEPESVDEPDVDRHVLHASVAAQALDSLGYPEAALKLLEFSARAVGAGEASTVSVAEWMVALAHHADLSGDPGAVWGQLAGRAEVVDLADLADVASAYRACKRMATVLQKWDAASLVPIHDVQQWVRQAQSLESAALALLDRPPAIRLWETSMILLAWLLPLSDSRVRIRVQETARRLKGERPDGTVFFYTDLQHAAERGPMDLSEMGYPAGAALLGVHAPLARELLILHAATVRSGEDASGGKSSIHQLGVTAAPLHMLATFGLCLRVNPDASPAFVRYNPYMAPYEVDGPLPVEATKDALIVGGHPMILMERPVGHCEVDYRVGWLAIENLGAPTAVQLDLGPWTVSQDVSAKVEPRGNVHVVHLDPWEYLELRLQPRSS